jgi:hypothetical protein
MSLIVEGVVDGGMDIEKTLRRSRRLEPLHLVLRETLRLAGRFELLHLPLSAARWLVRILRSVACPHDSVM